MFFTDSAKLGKKVSRIGLGGAGISGDGGGYGFGSVSEKEAEELLRSSWEVGINLYDTAPIYGFGLSEERFGRYLPQEAIIVSKGGVDWHPNRRVNMTNSPEVMERMFYESLKRLKREFIDIYMIHWPDPKVEIERPLEVLLRLKEKGLLKHIGLCNTTHDDFKKAQALTEVEALQSEVNFFQHESLSFLNTQEREQLFTMAWGTFDKGILSGRISLDRKFDSSDARSWAPWWKKSDLKTKILRAEKLKNFLNDFGISLAQFSLSYNLQVYGIATTLVGLKKTQDLKALTSDLNHLIILERMNEILQQWEEFQEE